MCRVRVVGQEPGFYRAPSRVDHELSPSRRCVVRATAATTRKTSNNAKNETYRLRALAACASADTKSSGNCGVDPLELSGSWLRLSA